MATTITCDYCDKVLKDNQLTVLEIYDGNKMLKKRLDLCAKCHDAFWQSIQFNIQNRAA